MTGKLPLSQFGSWGGGCGFSLQRSFLALAAFTLVCFTLISLRSLRSSFRLSSLDEVAMANVSVELSGTTPPVPSIYHSPEVFSRNYAEMERKFKVFIYPDGDPDTYFQTPRKLTGKYSSEGYFFQNIRESRFRTEDPDRADMFFVPVSCHKMRGKGLKYENMSDIVQDYVEGLIQKYPYWNRTLGADHFFVTCHDVGVRAFEGLSFMVKNSIRIVCSPSYNVGYIPHKDIALPQVLQPFALPAGGNDVVNRDTILEVAKFEPAIFYDTNECSGYEDAVVEDSKDYLIQDDIILESATCEEIKHILKIAYLGVLIRK